MNACEVKAHLIGCWQNLGAVCFWQSIPYFEKMSASVGSTREMPLDPAAGLPSFRPPHCPPLLLRPCGRPWLHSNAHAGGGPFANIAVNDIPLKTRFFGLHFTRWMYRCIFSHFYVIGVGPKSYRIRRYNAHGDYAVQGHLRSPILVPIESPYATILT